MSDTTGGTGAAPPGKIGGAQPSAGWQPGQGYWGYPPYVGYPVPQYPKASNATAILVLGIVSLALGWPLGALGIAAWVMGNRELREIDAGLRSPQGRGLAQAGRICGIIGTCLFGAGCVVAVIWVVVFFAFFLQR